MTARSIRSWNHWYRFARDTLGYRPEEAVGYANLRNVEETNRAILRSRAA